MRCRRKDWLADNAAGDFEQVGKAESGERKQGTTAINCGSDCSERLASRGHKRLDLNSSNGDKGVPSRLSLLRLIGGPENTAAICWATWVTMRFVWSLKE